MRVVDGRRPAPNPRGYGAARAEAVERPHRICCHSTPAGRTRERSLARLLRPGRTTLHGTVRRSIAARSAPEPKQAVTPTPPSVKQTPPKATQHPPAGRLNGLLEGLSDSDSDSRSTAPPAATVTPGVQSSLAAEVRRQLKPHWQPPSGADVEQLKTVLRINLARDGSVTSINFVTTTGINASNRTQADLHRERAIKAVRLASPFNLPPQYYDGWKSMTVNFDLRLSL